MSPVAVFTGHVTTAGKLVPDDKAGLLEHVQTMRGKRVSIVVKVDRETRSSRANRYYWGVIVKLLGRHCGYDPQDMHEALAMKFLRVEDCAVTGAPRRQRTPHTDSKEFADYVDQCIRLAAELGVVIPEPRRVEAA